MRMLWIVGVRIWFQNTSIYLLFDVFESAFGGCRIAHIFARKERKNIKYRISPSINNISRHLLMCIRIAFIDIFLFREIRKTVRVPSLVLVIRFHISNWIDRLIGTISSDYQMHNKIIKCNYIPRITWTWRVVMRS